MDFIRRLLNQWLVVAQSKDVGTRPVGLEILGTPIVLFRAQGRVSALLDRCPHRNAPLSQGNLVDATLQCPYHGWRFNEHGKCVYRPGCHEGEESLSTASAATPRFAVLEREGLIWVHQGTQPDAATPPENPWNTGEYGMFVWQDRIEADFVDAMENLLDATHTPFVHGGLVRSVGGSQRFRATVRIRENMVEAEYGGEGKQAGWISQIFERDRASSFGRFIPPCIAELEYTSKRGTEFVLRAYFTPINARSVQLISTFYVRKTRIPMTLKRWLLSPFFRRVLKQDRAILASQQQNVERFGGPEYQNWEGDLLRGIIESWLRNGKFPVNHREQTIDLVL